MNPEERTEILPEGMYQLRLNCERLRSRYAELGGGGDLMTSGRVTCLDTSRVLAAADLVTCDRKECLAWLNTPLSAFGGQTPEALIAIGRTNDVIRYLESLSGGYVG